MAAVTEPDMLPLPLGDFLTMHSTIEIVADNHKRRKESQTEKVQQKQLEQVHQRKQEGQQVQNQDDPDEYPRSTSFLLGKSLRTTTTATTDVDGRRCRRCRYASKHSRLFGKYHRLGSVTVSDKAFRRRTNTNTSTEEAGSTKLIGPWEMNTKTNKMLLEEAGLKNNNPWEDGSFSQPLIHAMSLNKKCNVNHHHRSQQDKDSPRCISFFTGAAMSSSTKSSSSALPVRKPVRQLSLTKVTQTCDMISTVLGNLDLEDDDDTAREDNMNQTVASIQTC